MCWPRSLPFTTQPDWSQPIRASEIDSLWFYSHPERQFHLRRQTPAEIAQCAVQPLPSRTTWCIISRETGELQAFALKAGETWGDDDIELAPFFEDLRSPA